MPGRIPDPRNRDAAIRAALRDDYEDWSVDELRRRAGELAIHGRSTMRKHELIAALRTR